ncbi:MAG: hypothetical protein M3Z37_00740 [Candidatus Eremiobacteraeota bacterium]|nr:hypothetical protein [Candidatus Eremiobacteraeota bacterium]
MIPLMDAWTTRAPPDVNERRHASSVSETSLRVSVHGAERRLCGDAIRAADLAEGSAVPVPGLMKLPLADPPASDQTRVSTIASDRQVFEVKLSDTWTNAERQVRAAPVIRLLIGTVNS